MGSKRRFRPTRGRPHRLCGPLHAAESVLGTLLVLGLCVQAPVVLGLVLAALGVLGCAVTVFVHRRSDIREVREVGAEENEEVRAGAVRPGWARAAAIGDALILGGAAPAVAQAVLSPRPLTEQLSTSSTMAGQAGVLVLAVLVFGCITFAHRQATVSSPAASGQEADPAG